MGCTECTARVADCRFKLQGGKPCFVLSLCTQAADVGMPRLDSLKERPLLVFSVNVGLVVWSPPPYHIANLVAIPLNPCGNCGVP